MSTSSAGAELAGRPQVPSEKTLPSIAARRGSVDLGPGECVEGGLDWDRVTEWSPAPNRACDEIGALYHLARNTGDPDFGLASSGEPRDVMDPDPPCP